MCTLNQIKSLVLQSHQPHFKLTGHLGPVATLLRPHYWGQQCPLKGITETRGNICFFSAILTRKEHHSQRGREQGCGRPATLRAVLHNTTLSHTSDYLLGKTPVYNYLSLEPVCWFVLVRWQAWF